MFDVILFNSIFLFVDIKSSVLGIGSTVLWFRADKLTGFFNTNNLHVRLTCVFSFVRAVFLWCWIMHWMIWTLVSNLFPITFLQLQQPLHPQRAVFSSGYPLASIAGISNPESSLHSYGWAAILGSKCCYLCSEVFVEGCNPILCQGDPAQVHKKLKL